VNAEARLVAAHEFFRKGEANAEGWSMLIAKSRNWESAYRDRWRHDKIVRSTHGVTAPGRARGTYRSRTVNRGFEVTVHVELTLKARATVEAFEAGIAALDEVLECRRMFGIPDYVIHVAVADQAAYEAFYMNELAELPGLARVNSQFTMKMVKAGGALPI
jgi:DNA-binding Lrp family transcriptional regulator